jgi:hypothetical protein
MWRRFAPHVEGFLEHSDYEEQIDMLAADAALAEIPEIGASFTRDGWLLAAGVHPTDLSAGGSGCFSETSVGPTKN